MKTTKKLTRVDNKNLFKLEINNETGHYTAFLSYGYWPVLVYDHNTKVCVVNCEYFSVTTNRHTRTAAKLLGYPVTQECNTADLMRYRFPFLNEYVHNYRGRAFEDFYNKTPLCFR